MRADYHGYRLPVGYRLLGVIALRARTRWRLYGKRGNEVVTGNHASGTWRKSTSRGYAHDRHVGAGSNVSCKAKQVCDRAPGALAPSRPSASSPVPALGRVSASFACFGVPALSACPNTSASLASLHVSASLTRPSVPALLNASASAPVPALSACPHAPASSHHVGAGSNLSLGAEQPSDRALVRDGRQTGQGRQHLSTSVNGSFATTYAEDRDGNSRASSFCLFST